MIKRAFSTEDCTWKMKVAGKRGFPVILGQYPRFALQLLNPSLSTDKNIGEVFKGLFG